MARSVHPVTEFDRRFLHAMHCRVDEPTPRPMPRAQDAYDTLAAAYERLDAEAAAAHLVDPGHEGIALAVQRLLDDEARRSARRRGHGPTTLGAAGGPSRKSRPSSAASVEG